MSRYVYLRVIALWPSVRNDSPPVKNSVANMSNLHPKSCVTYLDPQLGAYTENEDQPASRLSERLTWAGA